MEIIDKVEKRTGLDINDEEINRAIRKLKTNKNVGQDGKKVKHG